MGQCYGKNVAVEDAVDGSRERRVGVSQNGISSVKNTPTHPSSSPWPSPYPHAPSPVPSISSPLPPGVSPSPARSTPRRFFRRPFPPPSPAKHIKASLAKRQGAPKPKDGPIPEDGGEGDRPLDKSFGYSKNFTSKYELGHEVGRGHFGHTCSAKARKGELKGQTVAVKIISKAKMTTAIAIEDVRREVKILKALSGHNNLVRFYDACEDVNNVYIIMELCEGGELLDRILSRGGRYSEEDAKVIVVQILSIVAFCHLQGVVHRDLKPENFLFTTKDEHAPMKAIDFGLSDFIRPDERLNDIVGSAYYVAPEVLHRSYSMEADVWSIGVITYILLCGSRPFWARTESGIFRAVLRADPNFDDAPWPSVSPEAKDFVKRLLNKDLRKRMTAAQALTHPWLRGQHQIPLDILVYKLVKSYVRYSPLKRAALKAWFRELPRGVLDSLTPEQVMQCNTEEECLELVSFLPSTQAALLDWAINLMADVVQEEQHNKMNSRNIAMVFAPNMTQMADPLTALMYAVQVMNFLKTLILKTLRQREEAVLDPRLVSFCSDPPDGNGHDNASQGRMVNCKERDSVYENEHICGRVEFLLDGYSHSTEDESVSNTEENFLSFGEKDTTDEDGLSTDSRRNIFSSSDSPAAELRKTGGSILDGLNVGEVFEFNKDSRAFISENDHERASTSERDTVGITRLINNSIVRNNVEDGKGDGKHCRHHMFQVVQPADKSKGRSVINQINQRVERAEAWR